MIFKSQFLKSHFIKINDFNYIKNYYEKNIFEIFVIVTYHTFKTKSTITSCDYYYDVHSIYNWIFYYNVLIMFYFRRWEQYFQQDAADCHTMIDPSNEKEDVRSTNESKDLLYENQDRRVTTSTNAETMFRTWEMPHLQNIVYEDKNKYQFWQDSQHNESHANSFFGENTRAHHREQGNTLVISAINPNYIYLLYSRLCLL